MRKLRNEKGVITIITLLTILFITTFLMTSYILIANKVKTQKEMLSETRSIYEPKSSMEEIYNSFTTIDNVIPIYTVDQLLKIGSDDEIGINGKVYTFSYTQNYLLKSDLEFNATDKGLENNWLAPYENEDFEGNFEWSGHTIKVTKLNGETTIYDGTYINTVTGYPITLTNAMKTDLLDYKIYGNSIQDGTPSPTNPVEVQSVGDKCTNIFDGLLQEGDYDTGTNRISSVNYIPVKPETNYIISRSKVRVYFYDANYVQLSAIDIANTLTTPQNCKYIRCVWFSTTDTTQVIWINEGEKLLEYEPYTNKYKIPVIVKSTNIFDGLLQEGDYNTGTNRISSVNYIPVKPNTTYIFSRNNERVYFYDGNKNQLSSIDTGKYGNTVTTPEDTEYIRCVWFGTTDATQIIWINEGNNLLEYEPYKNLKIDIFLDEPLRKIGEYADYIDFENNKVVRVIKETIITGTENNGRHENGFYIFYLKGFIYDGNVNAINNGYMNYFPNNINYGAVYRNEQIGFYFNSSQLRIAYPEKTTKDEFLKWVVQKYNENNPVKVYSVLKTQIEEPIELPDIQLYKGRNIITVDTEIQPSNISVTYNAKQ